MIKKLSESRKLKKITMGVSIVAMGIILVSPFLSNAQVSGGETSGGGAGWTTIEVMCSTTTTTNSGGSTTTGGGITIGPTTSIGADGRFMSNISILWTSRTRNSTQGSTSTVTKYRADCQAGGTIGCQASDCNGANAGLYKSVN